MRTWTKSFRVAIAKSGMPRRDAVVAAPLCAYKRQHGCAPPVVDRARGLPLVQAVEAGLEGAPRANAVADARRDLRERAGGSGTRIGIETGRCLTTMPGRASICRRRVAGFQERGPSRKFLGSRRAL